MTITKIHARSVYDSRGTFVFCPQKKLPHPPKKKDWLFITYRQVILPLRSMLSPRLVFTVPLFPRAPLLVISTHSTAIFFARTPGSNHFYYRPARGR